jgi:hypothetical protein
VAEFRRQNGGHHLRFPQQVDFEIACAGDENRSAEVVCYPVPEYDEMRAHTLYRNAIVPLLGNFRGGLFLHGSAVRVDANGVEGAGAVAFLGLSRSGKTTLAGAFARCGHPFLTEDVIELERTDGAYLLQPKHTPLRLFADSAAHLLSDQIANDAINEKREIESDDTLPFAAHAAPLRHIYILGKDHAATLATRKLSLSEALPAIMPHAFILDVEDKVRLKAHFGRLADLTQHIPCYTLDFPRDYSELPSVMEHVLERYRQGPEA